MASRDVILTTLHGVRFEYAENFLLSLRRTGYQGEIVVFASRMKGEDIASLRRSGVTIVPFRFRRILVRRRLSRLWIIWRWFFRSGASPAAKETLAHAVFHLYYRRHLLYLQFLRKHRQDFDRVFLTDCRDVYFQADPFSWNLPRGLHVFLEEGFNKIGREIYHIRWIKSQFGQAVLDEIGGGTVSCAGTVMGDISSIMEYLSEMVSLTMQARSLHETDGDQGIHNYLIYKNRLSNVTVHDNRQGPVMTCGMTRPEDIRLNAQGFVINDAGKLMPVLHQYDRLPDLSKCLLDHLRQDVHSLSQ
jgi:hypothetical protein